MHVVVLVRSNPIVSSHRVVREVRRQLLQRRIGLRQRIGVGRVVAAIAGDEENLRVVLGGVIVLVAAVISIAASAERAREAGERYHILALCSGVVGGPAYAGILLV